MPHNLGNQKGFAALEAVLIVVILAILGGTGYYVYHANKKADDTLNSASQAAQSSPSKSKSIKASAANSAPKYFTITEWGVRAPETNGDTLTYKFTSSTDNVAEVISQKLSQSYGCNSYGAGLISRYSGTGPASDVDQLAPVGQTVAQYAATTNATHGQTGGYYYFFGHDQAACGSISAGPAGSPTAGEQAQSAANNFTQSLVPKLQAVPAQ
jgi:uncharacterized protein (UPF0333 family)